MPRGGKGRGQGRHEKPPEQRAIKISVTLPVELYRLLKAHGKHSKLIQALLRTYFEANQRPPETCPEE